jgi:ADP-ribose pyrophosphatase
MDLTEHCISTEDLAKGDFLCVKRDQVRLPSGHVSQREYVTHPGAVVIVPLLNNGNVVLERQFRYPLHQVFIELPAGKIDANESTLQTGQRELLEETGYQAQDWVKLGEQHPCIGYSNEVIHIYLARDLKVGVSHLDVDEALEVFELPLSEAIKLIQQGVITDSKTIVALFLTEKYIQNNE